MREWARTINPQFARVLRTIGFDPTWARAEGCYLFDDEGIRYLDLLGEEFAAGAGSASATATTALAYALDGTTRVQRIVGSLKAFSREELLELLRIPD